MEEATHNKGHILDLIITREQDAGIIQNLRVLPSSLSDHSYIILDLLKKNPRVLKAKIIRRNVKNIDIEMFTQDLKETSLFQNPTATLDEYVQCYNDSLRGILDKHAPSTEKEVVHRPHSPWYNEHIERGDRQRGDGSKPN